MHALSMDNRAFFEFSGGLPLSIDNHVRLISAGDVREECMGTGV